MEIFNLRNVRGVSLSITRSSIAKLISRMMASLMGFGFRDVRFVKIVWAAFELRFDLDLC